MGCTMTVGEQAMNIGRNAALAAGVPRRTVPGTTVDRQCGSSQQSIHFAAQAVMAGAMDIVIGAGVESMSRVPIGSTTEPGPGEAYGPLYKAHFELIHQGECAEEIARRWDISREEMDVFALESHRKAAAATEAGRFQNEIAPLESRFAEGVTPKAGTDGVMEADEGIRRDTSLEKLASLPGAFSPTGTVTAGTSSQISDGAAAVLIMSEARAAELGLRPRARFHTFAVAANDPEIMLTAVIPATRLVLEKAGLALDDIDVVEINEAFASVVLAWERELHPDMHRVNPNGGAIAIGHPTGCSGAIALHGHLAQRARAHRRPVAACRPCARAAWPEPTPPSSSGWTDRGRHAGGQGAGWRPSTAGSTLDEAAPALLELALHRLWDLRLPGHGHVVSQPGLPEHRPRDGRAVATATRCGPIPTPATSRPPPYVAADPYVPFALAAVRAPGRAAGGHGPTGPRRGRGRQRVGRRRGRTRPGARYLYEDDDHEYLVWKWRPVRAQ